MSCFCSLRAEWCPQTEMLRWGTLCCGPNAEQVLQAVLRAAGNNQIVQCSDLSFYSL